MVAIEVLPGNYPSRSRGAPVTGAVLPAAVSTCAHEAPPAGQSPSESYKDLLDMVRHLINVVGTDVNTIAAAPNHTCSTPLCRVACMPRGDPKELVSLLLDRGGDPNLALDDDSFGAYERELFSSALTHAKKYDNKQFITAVEGWQEKHRGEST